MFSGLEPGHGRGVRRPSRRRISRRSRESFEKQKAVRILRPLQWDHSDPETHHASIDQVITYLSDAWVDGETLWVAAYVTPEEAELLTGDDWPVSVHVVWNSQDQLGQTWPLQLLHVAIVDQPSMPGQRRFATLTAGLPKEETQLDPKVIEAVNKLLGAVKKGAKLPDDVDETNFAMLLEMAVSLITGDEAAKTASGQTPDDMDDADEPDGKGDRTEGPNAALGARLRRLERASASLGAQLAVLQGTKAQDAENTFAEAVAALLSNGTPASSRDALFKLGRANDWDTACLAGFDTRGVILGAQLRKLATTEPSKSDARFERDLRAQMKTAGYSDKEIDAAVARL